MANYKGAAWVQQTLEAPQSLAQKSDTVHAAPAAFASSPPFTAAAVPCTRLHALPLPPSLLKLLPALASSASPPTLPAAALTQTSFLPPLLAPLLPSDRL